MSASSCSNPSRASLMAKNRSRQSMNRVESRMSLAWRFLAGELNLTHGQTFLVGKAFPSQLLRVLLPLPAGAPRNAPCSAAPPLASPPERLSLPAVIPPSFPPASLAPLPPFRPACSPCRPTSCNIKGSLLSSPVPCVACMQPSMSPSFLIARRAQLVSALESDALIITPESLRCH